MATLLHVIWVIVKIVLILFVVTFTIYFFNLDMKLTAALQPMIQKWQEKVKRDRHL